MTTLITDDFDESYNDATEVPVHFSGRTRRQCIGSGTLTRNGECPYACEAIPVLMCNPEE